MHLVIEIFTLLARMALVIGVLLYWFGCVVRRRNFIVAGIVITTLLPVLYAGAVWRITIVAALLAPKIFGSRQERSSPSRRWVRTLVAGGLI